jgi:hypothetical protein
MRVAHKMGLVLTSSLIYDPKRVMDDLNNNKEFNHFNKKIEMIKADGMTILITEN